MGRLVSRQQTRLFMRLLRIVAPAVGIVGCMMAFNDGNAETTGIPLSLDEFHAVANKCAPSVSVSTLSALVRTESSYHPYAIAVVNGPSYYPATKAEAEAVIAHLETTDKSYSVGLGQINKGNFARFDVDAVSLLDPCKNLQISADILSECYETAAVKFSSQSDALSAALSCYYSGNFDTGKREGYVSRVVLNSSVRVPEIEVLKKGSELSEDDELLIITTQENPVSKPII